MEEQIKFEDITVVVQGPIERGLTSACLRSVRRHLPDAKIILSTWKGTSVDAFDLDYDVLLLNDDPGYFHYNTRDKKANNVNRLIVSTLNGLRACTTRYTLKLRTDLTLTGNSFLQFFDKFGKADQNFSVFQSKLLDCSYFSRNPRMKAFEDIPLLFHPSDIALFGYTEDLGKLFDVPLMQSSEAIFLKIDTCRAARYVPEQYIFVNCLRKNGHNIGFHHQRHFTRNLAEKAERYFASNFIFLNWKEFCVTPPEKFYDAEKNDYTSCTTHIEWQELYKKYVDKKHEVPSYDRNRELLNHIEERKTRRKEEKKGIALIARLCAIPFFGCRLKPFRVAIRKKIMELFDGVFPIIKLQE